ncbi:hypothetical protein FZO89_09210 [Luteimonas viscosa]|uniref:Uncharacterized protein n=1 Tax=Luteimonas viscosa TaxID=1132694 RepID=A0A5D4XUE8_9GAMM|nr:hypothetical protein [Luteimonas viscosa]TYT26420.1 hypothetical protein FZO89_09210 [Luteimonas viscosa]
MTNRPTPPPWKKKNPVKPAARTRLTEAQKDLARERAEAAGRRYPNLVDNMWAATQVQQEPPAAARDADEDDADDR